MNEETIQTITKLLESPKRIAIVGHKNPDGDAIGASLGLYHFLKGRGHNTQVVMPNDFPGFLKWLPGCDNVHTYDKDTQEVRETIQKAEIIFTLDFNALDRAGDLTELLEIATADLTAVK